MATKACLHSKDNISLLDLHNLIMYIHLRTRNMSVHVCCEIVYMYVCTYVCVYVCTYIDVHVCMYYSEHAYMYTHDVRSSGELWLSYTVHVCM